MDTHWWLMQSSFPSLNWARLRCHADGSADVFDMDARTLVFSSQGDAELHLLEDEFVRFSTLDNDDFRELGVAPHEITPPRAVNDAELVPLMYQHRT